MTEAAKKHPYMVLLLDEIEKAHLDEVDVEDGKIVLKEMTIA